jgi:hypothetical protein
MNQIHDKSQYKWLLRSNIYWEKTSIKQGPILSSKPEILIYKIKKAKNAMNSDKINIYWKRSACAMKEEERFLSRLEKTTVCFK